MARSPVKRFFGTLLLLLAVLAFGGFVLLLWGRALGQDQDFLGLDTPLWAQVVFIVLAVIILFLLLLLLVRRWDKGTRDGESFFIPEEDQDALARKRAEEFERAFRDETSFAPGPDIVVYNLSTVPLMGRAWEKAGRRSKEHPYFFPRSVESGLYVNTYVPVDHDGRVMKLRTLIAGPKGKERDPMPSGHEIKVPEKKPEKAEAKKEAAEPVAVDETAASRDQVQLLLERTGHKGTPDEGSFLHELEDRMRKPAPAPASRPAVFYDYPGDPRPLDELTGIGPSYASKLRSMGIEDTAMLSYRESDDVAKGVGVARSTVEEWKAMGELVKVQGIGPQYAELLALGGVDGIAGLKRKSAQSIADEVNAYLDTRPEDEASLRLSAKRVEAWQQAAKDLRRVRQKPPGE